MSECVVRMEMPKSCYDCPMEYDGIACSVTGTRFWRDAEGNVIDKGFDPSIERQNNCPIVCALPEGHGRLVDADEEIDFHVNDFERVKTEGMDVYGKAYSLCDLCDGITYAYDHANIIVPAERRANDGTN